MSQQIVQRFIEALRALEQERAVEPLASLYAEDAALGNVLSPEQFYGMGGARRFWEEYRGTFETVESSFRNVIATEDRAALEWTTEGASFDGAPVRYSGVTILETSGEKITRSTAYFDPGTLGRQIEAKSCFL